jgi:DnaJ-class molecular chaperone
MKDYYQILEIPYESTPDQIKNAYRRLVRKYHPDMNKELDKEEAEEKFKLVQEAYETLIDPIKKYDYDKSLFSRELNLETEFNDIESYGERVEFSKESEKIINELIEGLSNIKDYREIEEEVQKIIKRFSFNSAVVFFM